MSSAFEALFNIESNFKESRFVDSDSDNCPGFHFHDDHHQLSDIESHHSGDHFDLQGFPKMEKKISGLSSSFMGYCDEQNFSYDCQQMRLDKSDQDCIGSQKGSEGLNSSIYSVRGALKDGSLTKRIDYRSENEPRRAKKLKREHPEMKTYNFCKKCIDRIQKTRPFHEHESSEHGSGVNWEKNNKFLNEIIRPESIITKGLNSQLQTCILRPEPKFIAPHPVNQANEINQATSFPIVDEKIKNQKIEENITNNNKVQNSSIESEQTTTEKSQPFSIEENNQIQQQLPLISNIVATPTTDVVSQQDTASEAASIKSKRKSRKVQKKIEFQAKLQIDEKEEYMRLPANYSKFLLIDPSDLFYKKLGNERHYYICQLANGAAGIYLQKPDWLVDNNSLNLSQIQQRIQINSSNLIQALAAGQISLKQINQHSMQDLLKFCDESQIPESIQQNDALLKLIKEAEQDFGENVGNQIYGKKKHSYKIPNVSELQKVVTIPENQNIESDFQAIYFKIGIRALFFELLNDNNGYQAIVDKVIDHVKAEISKNKKDINEKLPELKRVFYITNQKTFVQKFTEAPNLIKNGKLAFQYYIPQANVKLVIDDFVKVMTRQNQQIMTDDDQNKFCLYPFACNQKQYSIKGDELWFGFALNDLNDLSSQTVLQNLNRHQQKYFIGESNIQTYDSYNQKISYNIQYKQIDGSPQANIVNDNSNNLVPLMKLSIQYNPQNEANPKQSSKRKSQKN